MVNKAFTSICTGNRTNIPFALDNIHNGANLLRPCFEFEVSIDYLTDTFDLFHFGANLSYACELSIHSTGQEKVIPTTGEWSGAWSQHIKIDHTRGIIWLMGRCTIEKAIILKNLINLIFIVRHTWWLDI